MFEDPEADNQGILWRISDSKISSIFGSNTKVNGVRSYGPANGAIWWQTTVRQIRKGHVLVALIFFQDGSWVKINLSCEQIYADSTVR